MRSKKSKIQEDFLAEYRDNNYYTVPRDNSSRQNSKQSSASKVNTKKKKRKKKRKWPYVIIVLLLLAAAIPAAVYSFLDSQVSKFTKIDTTNETFGIESNVDESLKDYESIAILGLDARSDEDPKDSRADAIIIATVNKTNGNISLTSVMRDSYLPMNNSHDEVIYDKATHSHIYGGPVNTVTMLNKSLDLNIRKFFVLTWNSVADMVDAMGGIDVDIKENEIDDLNRYGNGSAENTGRQWTDITAPGVQRINGAQAVTYCRIRETSGGDIGRTARMKVVISALFDTMKSNLGKITSMTDVAFPQITTNMDTGDFIKYIPKALKLKIDQSISYPKNFWGGIVGEAWVAVPTTLEKNAEELHSQLFPDINYTVSERLKKISDEIVFETGISEGLDISDYEY